MTKQDKITEITLKYRKEKGIDPQDFVDIKDVLIWLNEQLEYWKNQAWWNLKNEKEEYNQAIKPTPPLYRVIRQGVSNFCSNCGSTMPRSGFLMFFGKRYCDNDKCKNSKKNRKLIKFDQAIKIIEDQTNQWDQSFKKQTEQSKKNDPNNYERLKMRIENNKLAIKAFKKYNHEIKL